jgi:hypothetical protein
MALATYHSAVQQTTSTAVFLTQLTVTCMSQCFSTCLSLQSLAVCDWAHVTTVFVMILVFMPHCV